MSENQFRLGSDEIQKFLPHRYPFLFVDRILSIDPVYDANGATTVGTKVAGLKNITVSEGVFQGHFPGFSIFPGALIIETMAQVSSFGFYPNFRKSGTDLAHNFQCILVGVDQARFRKPVTPGDSLRIESEVTRQRGMLWGFRCEAYVGTQLVAEAEIMANLVPNGKADSK